MSLVLRRPDGVDEALQAGIAVAQPQLGGGEGEARALRAEAQVAADGEVEPAADAIALDGGDGRFREGAERRIEALADGIVALDRLAGGALVLELGDVGARHERLAAGPGDHQHAHVVVPGELLEDARAGLPHLQRYGVVPRRIVEGHCADAALFAGQHLVGDGHRLPPLMRSSIESLFRYEVKALHH